jgi:hypothetical protein
LRRIIDIGGGDDWGQRVHIRRWSSFGVGGILLVHLLFFIRVDEDYDVVVVGWPKKPTVEVAEESPGKLLIP